MSANSIDVKPSRLANALSRATPFWSIAGVLLLAAILSRFLFLEEKAFHHDESLHAYYSNRVANGIPHEYSALLHGPFLYYFTGAVMWFFGSTDFVARGASAFFGVLLVASPLLMRRFWGPAATLALMTLFLVSPMTLYFARFLREDAFTTVWALGTVFAAFLFWRTRAAWTLYLATALLAFHFVNKENSYLHSFVWLLAMGAIAFFVGRLGSVAKSDQTAPFHHDRGEPLSKTDKGYLVLNAASIFTTIYVLFYSSFFRHSKGSWHGIVDGLYRESLLYWWDQNQKRRIDGPFDYHLPLISNYEFLALPFLAFAWWRVVTIARREAPGFFSSKVFIGLCLTLFAACFLVPRIALVPDACSYTSVCLDTASKALGDLAAQVAKPLHLSHSRHFLQILAYVAFGAAAFFSALRLRRRFDAFVWFWLTGALGIYSYVGEKVPWLTAYILLPLFVLAAMEIARLLTRSSLPSDTTLHGDAARVEALETADADLSHKARLPALVWVAFALPFTLWKGYAAAFLYPDSTRERVVFTQTTPTVKLVRDRWRQIAKANPGKPFKVGMFGDSTWPFAWYTEEFGAGDFAKPTPETAKNLDVVLLDYSQLEAARKEFPEFDIYALPLRHWWVPGQDPSLPEIARYFVTGQHYKRTPQSTNDDLGVGETKVLYLEKRASAFFQGRAKPDFLALLHEATTLVPN
ncbi:MAG: TIGR03663 family protein [Silvanigrellales bacterium]|nr:TIGR03663 family protein [Silvanigrellales bacterium]